MKKIILSLALLSLFIFPNLALAEEKSQAGGGFQAAPGLQSGGGFTGPDATPKVTVAEALKLGDGASVALTGHIEKRLGPEKYQFRDGSGSLIIEIDDEDWRGLSIGPDDQVEIHGQVDKDFSGRKIEVKTIRKL